MEPAATPAAPAAAPGAVETVSGASLLSSMPPVNERAVAAVSPAAAAVPGAEPKPAAPEFPPDAKGRAWDPRIYRLGADGKPFLNGKGMFMPRGGRKPGLAGEQSKLPFAKPAKPPAETGSTVPPELLGGRNPFTGEPAPQPAPAAAEPPKPAAPAVDPKAAELTAEMYLRIGYQGADSVFGGKKEWLPDDDAEHRENREVLALYLQTGGARALSPGEALAVRLAVYVWKRVSRSHTAQVLRSWWAKLTGKPVASEPSKETDKPGQPAQPAAPKPAPVAQPQIQILPFRE